MYVEDELISEGGYGFVYRVHLQNNESTSQTEYYALKRMVLQEENAIIKAKKEIDIWSQLRGHPSIVEYIDSDIIKVPGTSTQEMLVLCELCPGGFTLVDMLQTCKLKIMEHVILSIMLDICLGVQHMHDKGISHRDLKVENILLKQ